MTCPFCEVENPGNPCSNCKRDPTARRKVCAACKKMTPLAEENCCHCGAKQFSEMRCKIPTIIIMFVTVFVVSTIVAVFMQ